MKLSQIDFSLFQTINQLCPSHPILSLVMKFLSLYGAYILYLGIVVYWFSGTKKNRQMVLQALLSACVALGISGVIGHFFYRPRPFATHDVIQLIDHANNASFPSNHATGALVIAVSFWLFRKKMSWAWLLLALGIAFSRVWVGVHYPGDVLVGSILGTLTALTVHYLLPKVKFMYQTMNEILSFATKVENGILTMNSKNKSS
ncbi:undecaprenyl-diphosphatase [Aneurinibacillus uraniidurans]|uniref:undecaprenyl-diphosphatase n=1 Tax=Aneurinibacillus uraniidurans TaxID=2966586 RepID=UPI00234A2EDD|nr:undecaprenyl-diphosphatase [Aneurinibacillus sp. B1]WCN39199.1 undecaprenyl-diphosphatase [Aneurinibacillus sp. B1]